jgi:ribonuclease G
MIQHIKRLLGIGKPNPARGNSIVVNVEKLERRVALLEDGVLEEYTVEREGDQNIVGGIFKGRVKNIEGGLKAMFVDIGLDKNAFLHFWDAIPAALDAGLEEIQREGKRKQQKKISSKDIPDIYPIGSEIVIQVSKGPIGTKGPRVTTNISLAGRYLVLMPFTEQFGISRKIEDPKERQRLRIITQKLQVPEGMGIIMRTAASGIRRRHLVRDLHMLLEQWDEIEARRANNPAPACIFQEPGLIERTARDFLTEEIDQVMCDDAETTEMIREIAGKISRRAKRRIHYMPSAAGQPIFERINIQKQIDEAFSRQVWLPCGGYIVIDETEALIAIDVNTGRNRGSKDVDKMILETNVEAAVEVARQLRLRNIGGLVVIDLIDMRHRKDQQTVYKAIKERLKKDKAKTQVLQISPVGLMEMTRQRLNESLRDSMYEPCPYCQGRARVKTPMTMSIEIQRRLHTVIQKRHDTVGDIIVIVNSDVLNRFKSEDAKLLVELERSHSGRLIFRSDPTMNREKFLIIDAATEKTIDQS